MGMRVVFGHQFHVTNSAFANAKSGDFYFTNHPIEGKYAEYLKSIIQKGVHMIGTEEEGVFDLVDYKIRLAKESNEESFENFKMWMPWGSRDAEAVQRMAPRDLNVFKFGTSRSALWGEFGEKLYFREKEEIYRKYGNFVLIVTSFDSNIMSHKQAAMKANYGNKGFTETVFESGARRVNSNPSLTKVIQAILSILEESELNVLIRPYGSSKERVLKTIKNAVGKAYKHRVFIDDRLQISPLIFASKAVIHLGSTAGVEALCIGKNVISLHRFGSPDDHGTDTHISSLLSNSPTNTSSLIQMLSHPSIEIRDAFREVLYKPSGMTFYFELANSLNNIEPNAFTRNAEYEKLTKSQRTYLQKLLPALRGSKMYKYDLHKRPKVTDCEIHAKFNDAMALFNSNEANLKLIKIERNTYLVSSSQLDSGLMK
jgi:surface carbohydrate biosynthesis protein